jgi:hypothetical protein
MQIAVVLADDYNISLILMLKGLNNQTGTKER